MSAVSSGAASKTEISSVVRIPLMTVAACVLACTAAIMPQYFIRESLGSEKLAEAAYGEILPWVAALFLLAMTVGPGVWLFGRQRRPKSSPTRLIVAIFAAVGLALIVAATIGAVATMRFGHSTQDMQQNLGPMYLFAVVGAIALELFAVFLLFQASARVYKRMAT